MQKTYKRNKYTKREYEVLETDTSDVYVGYFGRRISN